MRNALSVISGFVFVAGFVPYILAILRGETKPSKVSWIIWASLDVVTLAAMYCQNAVNGQIVGAVAGASAVIILALKYVTPGWTKLDKFCLGGAIVGIVLWRAFSNPSLGILTSAITAFIGSVPTFVSAWKDPSREDKLAWTIFWISCVCAISAIPHWTLADATQPIVFFAIETTMMFILFVPRNRAK